MPGAGVPMRKDSPIVPGIESAKSSEGFSGDFLYGCIMEEIVRMKQEKKGGALKAMIQRTI